MSEEEPSVADLVRASIGGDGFTARPPAPPEVTQRSILLPVLGLAFFIGIFVVGLGCHLYETRQLDSNDVAVTFSKPDAHDALTLKRVESYVSSPTSTLDVRSAHVTYSPPDSGFSLPGLAVILKGHDITAYDGEALALTLGGDGSAGRDPAFGGQYVVTLHRGGTYVQVLVVKGKMCMAVGANLKETSAVLRVLAHDEGISLGSQKSSADHAVAGHQRSQLVL